MPEREIHLGEKLDRTFRADEASVNTETRTATLSFASDTQDVKRYYDGQLIREVLSHSEGDVDLSRLESSGPLLLNHDIREQVGAATRVWVDRGKGLSKSRAEVKFSRSERGTEIMNDVADGIRGTTSVGYELLREVSRDSIGGETVVRFAWRPFELTLTPVPADSGVGVGRSEKEPPEPPKKERKMSEEKETVVKEVEVVRELSPEEREAIAQEGQKREHDRVTAIEEAAKELSNFRGIDALASKAKRESWSPERFNKESIKEISSGQIEARELGLSEKEKKEYSVVRALNAQVQMKTNSRVFDGLEADVHNELSKRWDGAGHAPKGVLIPTRDLEVSKTRALEAGASTEGAELVQTDVGPMIELLRNRMVTSRAGARMLNGLRGDVSLPRHSATGGASWVDEEGSISESSATLGSVSLSPKRLAANQAFSKQLLAQSENVDVENFVRQDLIDASAVEVDETVLNGSGSGNEPQGVLNTSGIGAVTYGGAATYADYVNHWADVAAANANRGSLAYIVSAAAAEKGLTIERATNTGIFIFSERSINDSDFSVLGYPVYVSEQVSANKSYFGNWEDAICATWGDAIDVVVDPYTLAATGQVRIVTMVLADIAVRIAGSFSVSADSAAQ